MRIVITRDGAIVRHVDVGDKDLRIGRSADNDIVLEDQDKSVSRMHAELRHQGDRLMVLDLNSQNGVWVNGRRVPSAYLDAETPITIGCYVLSLESSGPPIVAAVPVSNETVRIEVARNQTAAYVRPVAARVATDAVGESSAARAAGASRVDPLTRLARLPKPKLFALFGGLAVVAVLVTVMLKPSAAPVDSATDVTVDASAAAVAEHLSAAKDLLAAGQPRAAIDEHLDRVLLVVPDHPEALDLKAAAGRVLETTPAAASEPAAASVGSSAAVGSPVAAATSPGAPAAPPSASAAPPSASAPTAPGAAGPDAPAAAKPSPAPGGARTAGRPPPPATAPVEDPPFARRPGETQTAWRERGAELQKRYRAAMAVFGRGDYDRATEALEAIANDQPRYLDVEARLAEARQRTRASADSALRAGADFEKAGALGDAVAQYERALQIDPQLDQATAALAALRAKLEGAPEEFFRQARQYDALGFRGEALDHYERALATLPATDARRATATERASHLRPLIAKPGAGR